MAEDRENGRAVDALDRYWEGLLRREHVPPPAPDAALRETVRRVHALPDAPGPEAAFVAKLEENLMRPYAAPVPARIAGGAAGTATNGSWLRPFPTAGRSTPRPAWRRAADLAAVAVLVLAIAGGAWAGRGLLPGGGDGDRTRIPAVTGTAPGDAVEDGVGMFLGNAARTGEVPGPGPREEPELLWDTPIAPGETGGFWDAPVVVDGTAYVVGNLYTGEESRPTETGYVLALDAATGAERWRTKILEYEQRDEESYASLHLQSLTVAGGAVLVGATLYEEVAGSQAPAREAEDAVAIETTPTSTLVSLDALTGAERWRSSTGAVGTANPAVTDGVVYVGAEGGEVRALDAATGAERWRSALASGQGDGDVWIDTIAVADGGVYAVVGGTSLHALDAGTGAERWRFGAADADALSIPVVADGTVFVGANVYPDEQGEGDVSGRLHALDAATGAERWTYDGASYASTPTVGASLVYVVESDGDESEMVALDAALGKERWSAEINGSIDGFPLLSAGVLYFLTLDPPPFNLGPINGLLGIDHGRSIHALDAASGERLWRIETELEVGWPTVAGGMIYQLNGASNEDAGTLHAYGDD